MHQITACHVRDKFTIHVKYKTQSMSCDLLEEDNGDTHTSLIIYMWTKIPDKEKGVRDCEKDACLCYSYYNTFLHFIDI